MPSRLKPLDRDEAADLLAELKSIELRLGEVGNILGPAFGAKWCDVALKAMRLVWRMQMPVEDRIYELDDPRSKVAWKMK